MTLPVDNFAHSRSLSGSPRTDAFKVMHKQAFGEGFWASDFDVALLAIIQRVHPWERATRPEIVCFYEIKGPNEPLSMCNVVLLNFFLRTHPVYVITVDNASTGPYKIEQYLGGDPVPRPCLWERKPVGVAATPAHLRNWEAQIIAEWRKQPR